jgi:hypothetical protein
MAYLYYYATATAFEDDAEDGRLKKRLQELVGDALIVAEQAKFDVFNALTLMENVSFFSDLKVTPVPEMCEMLTHIFLNSLGLGTVCLISTCTTGGQRPLPAFNQPETRLLVGVWA